MSIGQRAALSILVIMAMVSMLLNKYNDALIYSLILIGCGVTYGTDAIYRALEKVKK